MTKLHLPADDKIAGECSGGEKRRVALCKVLLEHPDLPGERHFDGALVGSGFDVYSFPSHPFKSPALVRRKTPIADRADFMQQALIMPVQTQVALAMVNDHQQAITPQPVGKGDAAVDPSLASFDDWTTSGRP